MAAYLEKYKDDENSPEFNASKGFIYDFKKNHGITSRKCHTKRRPDNKKYDKKFADSMSNLFANTSSKYIVNIDETAWETVPEGLRAWHLVGEDHVVRYVNANEKEKITVVAAIAADGTKLPLQFIAKGDSPQVIDTQIGDVAYHLKTFSPNGWTTSETFKEFLLSVRNFYGFDDKNTIHVLLDVFRAHLTDDVKELADQLNIKMYLIPAGFTDMLQPLDKKIFGPMKTFARKLFRMRYTNDPNHRRTKLEACQDMVRAWERLTPELIQESFKHLHELENWTLPQPSENYLLRHHRAYCTASSKERKEMEETYKDAE